MIYIMKGNSMFHKLSLIVLAIFLATGCGSDTTTLQDQESIQKVTYDNNAQERIALSKEGVLKDVTYICIGDSTRAISDVTEAQLLFEQVASSLANYHVTSYLQARGSHTLEDFIYERISPTWSDVVALIPNEGESTIVDISLGVNDLFALHVTTTDEIPAAVATIKARLREAIALVKNKKPKTTFFLTSPNPSRVWGQGAQIYQDAYIQVAQEDGYLFVNFVDNIMPSRDSDPVAFDAWYRDDPEDEIHFSRYGLEQVANYILSIILP